MNASLRIGAVNYLNTKPLIHELTALAPQTELILEVPSRLADLLAEGRLDVGLIPAIEYFRAGTYSIVPGLCIGSRGPVLSVTLFSRVPWTGIRKVALDVGSRTSAALTQIVLKKRYGIAPQIVPLPMDQQAEQSEADAVLLIGDRAMRACLPGFEFAFDLGREWHDWTGLPFVYAFWAVREGVVLGEVEAAFHEALRRGRRQVGRIAQEEAPGLGLDAGFCRRYLDTIIQFDMGARELEGLRHYYELAQEVGVVSSGTCIKFYRPVSSASEGFFRRNPSLALGAGKEE